MTTRFDSAQVVPWVPEDDTPPTIVLPPQQEDSTPASPVMEKTFSLIVWMTGSLLVALLATVPMYLAGAPAFFNVALGIVIVGVLVFVYLAFDSRWFHTVSLQRTERMKIEAQRELGHRWFDYQERKLAAEMPQALPAPQPEGKQIAIHSKGQTVTMPLRDNIDTAAEEWIAELFSGGVLDSKKVLDKTKKKPGMIMNTQKPGAEVMLRLQARQLVKDNGPTMIWTGPPTERDAIKKYRGTPRG